MNLPDGLIPSPWLWLGHALYVPILAYALWRAPWPRLKDNASLHLYLGTCVALLVLWTLRAGVSPGLTLHLLGATFLTLMFGWRLALAGMSAVILGNTLYGVGGMATFSLNALVMGAVPVFVSQAMHGAARRFLPRHPFVYLFVPGFFGAAVAAAASALVASALLFAAGVYPAEYLAEHYLPYIALMLFPEAFVTGACLSYFVVYHPEWVGTYREELYLKG